MSIHKTIAIAGNPNCGKTVIFNALTGSRQKVGNWAGVTVEKKSGTLIYQQEEYQIVDLPGTYSLSVVTDNSSLDERIACQYLLSGTPDVVINVVDASNLERHLYLTAQLIEMQVPVVVALNMTDIAEQQGIEIDVKHFSELLGCPVVPLVAHRGKGIAALKAALASQPKVPKMLAYELVPALQQAWQQLTQQLQPTQSQAKWLALRLLEDDRLAQAMVSSNELDQINTTRQQLTKQCQEEADLIIAAARHCWVKQLLKQILQQQHYRSSLTERIDRIVLNRWLGIPIFLFVMYLMFLFAINIGGAFQDFFDIGSATIFIDGLAYVLTQLHLPPWSVALIADGIGKGINTTITFIPVIGSMYLFLSLLEDSGYMARAAFVVDRLMRAVGLPGKAFVPLIVGFGCNVPAIMAVRTLSAPRDRILTVMMAPFMSCGARLAVYAAFVAAFFPRGGQNIIFALYLLGIAVAILTGILLRKTVLKSQNTPMILELPAYHQPHLGVIFRNSWQRLKAFLFKAGRFIIPICMVIGLLNAINTHGQLIEGEANQDSILSAIGKEVTPIFAPMGIHNDNWPATVGLVTGMLAKEVVVGTLNTLYSQLGNLQQTTAQFDFWGGLHDAVMSIPENLSGLTSALLNPIEANASPHDVNDGVYGVMYQHFDGQMGAFAYLLFILLYFPCISTMAVMRREIGRAWTYFSMIWSTGLAYGLATLFYQIATFMRHPFSSGLWITGVLLAMLVVVLWLRYQAKHLPPVKKIIPITPIKS